MSIYQTVLEISFRLIAIIGKKKKDKNLYVLNVHPAYINVF